MKKREGRRWTLWVFKVTGQYFDFGETPRIGGRPTCRSDFEEVVVKEVLKRRRRARPCKGDSK